MNEYLETVVRMTLLPGERQIQGSIHSRLLDCLGLPITAGPHEPARRFHEPAPELYPDHGVTRTSRPSHSHSTEGRSELPIEVIGDDAGLW